MAVVVAFMSQKGGVGKSTLARGLATFAARAGLKTKIADLDAQQRTVVVWERARRMFGVEPAVNVEAYTDATPALESATNVDLLILDMPGQMTDSATGVAQRVHLVVQPTSPSADDLHLSVLVFQALERVGIPREKLTFALCRVLSYGEERTARTHLSSFGYTILKEAIPEHLSYREAVKIGRSLGETQHKTLNRRAMLLITDLLEKAMANAEGKAKKRAKKQSA